MQQLIALMLLAAFPAVLTNESSVLSSTFAAGDVRLDTNPNSEIWANAPRVTVDRDYFGDPIPGPPTEFRSRWTKEHLYLLSICPYDEVNLKPEPDTAAETPRLWNWDVAEAFIGSDFEHIARYKEFQVSPQGEWVDLEIDRENTQGQAGAKWNSGMVVAARIDSQRHADPVFGHRFPPSREGQGPARRALSHCRRRGREETLRVATHRPDFISCTAGVRNDPPGVSGPLHLQRKTV
jgi:hypothetical protein